MTTSDQEDFDFMSHLKDVTSRSKVPINIMLGLWVSSISGHLEIPVRFSNDESMFAGFGALAHVCFLSQSFSLIGSPFNIAN